MSVENSSNIGTFFPRRRGGGLHKYLIKETYNPKAQCVSPFMWLTMTLISLGPPEAEVLSSYPPIPKTADFMDEGSLSSSITLRSALKCEEEHLRHCLRSSPGHQQSFGLMGSVHIPKAWFILPGCKGTELGVGRGNGLNSWLQLPGGQKPHPKWRCRELFQLSWLRELQ